MTPVRISLTLSRHPFISSIDPGRFWRLLPVLAQSCCILVLAGRPAFARPCEGVHRSMSLIISSLLLQHWPACLVRLTWIVFVMGGKWPSSCCFVHPYGSIDATAAWKKLRFISSVRSDFHMTDSLSIAVHAFASCVLMSVSVDETLLPR